FIFDELNLGNDCPDRNDEMHCSARQCSLHTHPCYVTDQCVDIRKVFNGQQDFIDSTDNIRFLQVITSGNSYRDGMTFDSIGRY
ncbi:unnamed protein product, partial [Rotaria sordida]